MSHDDGLGFACRPVCKGGAALRAEIAGIRSHTIPCPL